MEPFDYNSCKSSFIMVGICGPRGSAGLGFLLLQLPAAFVGFIAGVVGAFIAHTRRLQLTFLLGVIFLIVSSSVTGYYFAKYDV